MAKLRVSFLLFVSIFVGCSDPIVDGSRDLKSGNPATRPLSSGLAEFLIRVDDPATYLAKVFENPDEISPRRQLATVYLEEPGFFSIGQLFLSTAEMLDDGPAPSALSDQGVDSLACNIYAELFEDALESANASRTVEEDLVRRRMAENPNFAILASEAEAAIGQHGSLCDLLAEWSFLTMNSYMRNPELIEPHREELAIRLFLTLSESGHWPQGGEGSAYSYLFLADYFLVRGDSVTAYAAVLMAKRAFENGSAIGSWERGNFSRAIETRLRQLQASIKR